MDDNADPSDGLMNMLKKIYSEGDDEMKRTINKVWTESQEKRLRGEETLDFWTALSDHPIAKSRMELTWHEYENAMSF